MLSSNKLQCYENNLTDCNTTIPEKTDDGYLICKECDKGFYQDVTPYGAPSNLGCKEPCTDIHKYCSECSSDGSTCEECTFGYVVASNGKTCVEAIDKCLKVSEDGLSCEDCKDGFYWNGEICDHCKTQNCKECQDASG